MYFTYQREDSITYEIFIREFYFLWSSVNGKYSLNIPFCSLIRDLKVKDVNFNYDGL